ncbi:1,4-alpha-glucan branching enzyme [Sterolibacterium denitrificans]|uniref:1,4-alpha-glucan branching enzyme GlgB n=1 Tax=Sterolibacterium denitrificans TaxID=157592 RepID=A0A7Z7MUP4_9PROT|nr:1,4-alpha-glucan branching protein GlgB [Sterolibacterium denitrificans]SMB23934.1 1,4-alpha-glucan branching enzyme [Sterolibacterium denitrificans]
MTRPPFSALLEARSHDPFGTLGLRRDGNAWLLRVFQPHAQAVAVEWLAADRPGVPPDCVGSDSLRRVDAAGIFEWRGRLPDGLTAARPQYALLIDEGKSGRAAQCQRIRDPYAFPPQPPADDLYLFNEGRNCQSHRLLGAACGIRHDGVDDLDDTASEWAHGVPGVTFRVWAPNAERVSVIGPFNRWDGRVHQMQSLGASGIWELFIPHLAAGTLYKYEIRNRGSGAVIVKSDPYARQFEHRPATASRVVDESTHVWRDGGWLGRRAMRDWLHAPLSIYEVHAGSWMRHVDGSFYGYRELSERLIPYVLELGFTHIEFMPLMEHPLDESWGYQSTGYFAPTSRFGTADDLRFLIDACHRAGLGVILDWVPGHFPNDEFALAHFDGSPLYEHEDPRLKYQPDWGTHVFNFGRNEVRSFLLSSAHYWLSEFHADGLRVDAVASMLYLDYSRKAGEWLPNRHGGRENLEAIQFFQELNTMVHREFPGALTMAEESTAWPMVSRPVHLGGLGFSMKWNMGWMNDTLDYMQKDPVHRRFHHQRLTFGQLYAYSENFILPLSHDEVVHGKRALLAKMPGDDWQRRANLRLLLAYQMTMPGKKLLFMGGEFGVPHEWRCNEELPWRLLDDPCHAGLQALMRDLNRLHVSCPALHELDFEAGGFSWIDCHDSEQSVISWLRHARDGRCLAVVCNFTPVPRHGYRIGVPQAGVWREVLNTDSTYYGGSNLGNGGVGGLQAVGSWMGRPASLVLDLPPLAAVVLEPAD